MPDYNEIYSHSDESLSTIDEDDAEYWSDHDLDQTYDDAREYQDDDTFYDAREL